MNSLVFEKLPNGEVIAYDLRSKKIIDEITDYSIWLLDVNRRDPKTIGQQLGHIARFWVYLRECGKSLTAVSDGTITQYMSRELKMVLSNSRSRGSERAAKSTVNQKISAILNWLLWLQNTGMCHERMIGPYKCRVTASPKKNVKDLRHWAPGQGIYSSLLYRDAGTSGAIPRADRNLYVCTLRELERMTEWNFVSERDKIFLDIAMTAGFRRGSICSLTVNQFDAKQIRRTTAATMGLTPKVQKFKYENEFQVDTLLMLRILDYIEGPRASLLVALGLERSDLATNGHLFLSATTGKAMTDRAMTARISRAMRNAGAKKGMAIHAHRGLFAMEATESVMKQRLQIGADTSIESVAHQVAPMLGHKNVKSQFQYTAGEQGRIGRQILAKQSRENGDSKND